MAGGGGVKEKGCFREADTPVSGQCCRVKPDWSVTEGLSSPAARISFERETRNYFRVQKHERFGFASSANAHGHESVPPMRIHFDLG